MIIVRHTSEASSLCVQTGSGAHPASWPMDTGSPFPGGQARPGRDADHSPQNSAEVKWVGAITPLTMSACMVIAGQIYSMLEQRSYDNPRKSTESRYSGNGHIIRTTNEQNC
jgi:hypothetical protein